MRYAILNEHLTLCRSCNSAYEVKIANNLNFTFNVRQNIKALCDLLPTKTFTTAKLGVKTKLDVRMWRWEMIEPPPWPPWPPTLIKYWTRAMYGAVNHVCPLKMASVDFKTFVSWKRLKIFNFEAHQDWRR